MSKAKYRKGGVIRSLDEMFTHDLVYIDDRVVHEGWYRSYQMGYLQNLIARGRVHRAVLKTEQEDFTGYFRHQLDLFDGFKLTNAEIDHPPIEVESVDGYRVYVAGDTIYLNCTYKRKGPGYGRPDIFKGDNQDV